MFVGSLVTFICSPEALNGFQREGPKTHMYQVLTKKIGNELWRKTLRIALYSSIKSYFGIRCLHAEGKGERIELGG